MCKKQIIVAWATNFENTNSLAFARRRLRAYFRTLSGEQQTIEKTITFMLRPNSSVPYNDDLIGSLAKIGISVKDVERGFFVKRDFFQNIHTYMKIQRSIEEFNEKQKENIAKVRNFAVVPLFSYRRQHVRIDKAMFYKMMCYCKTITKVKGKKNKMIIPTFKEFSPNIIADIGKVLNLPKIERIGGKNNTFHIHLMSDGVAVSLLYKKKIESVSEKRRLNQIKRRYENSEYIFVHAITAPESTNLQFLLTYS